MSEISVDAISRVMTKLELAKMLYMMFDKPEQYMSDTMNAWLVKVCGDDIK